MRTVDSTLVRAPLTRVYEAAREVERWPAILPHYRWVRVLERRGDRDVVEMAAWRPFGRLGYPTWWVSEMWCRPEHREVHYRHVRGITRGMEVLWRLEPVDGGVRVTIVHQWDGPAWPLVGRLAADLVIGPVFIHGIASRTLSGIRRFVESDAGA